MQSTAPRRKECNHFDNLLNGMELTRTFICDSRTGQLEMDDEFLILIIITKSMFLDHGFPGRAGH